MEAGGASKALALITDPITNLMFKRFLRNLRKLTANGVPAPA